MLPAQLCTYHLAQFEQEGQSITSLFVAPSLSWALWAKAFWRQAREFLPISCFKWKS